MGAFPFIWRDALGLGAVVVMETDQDVVLALCKEIEGKVIQWRRQIHAYPELGFREFSTSQLATQVLRDEGLEVRTGIADTGIEATLYGCMGGPTVALRADMDALPIREETSLPFASRVDSVMHACGHDGHTAMLLGAATVLSRLRGCLPGNVKFIFQPSEEQAAGALPMIEKGVLDNPPVDAIFAIHIWPDIPYGCIGVHCGPAMASLDEFFIKIHGRGGHVATPHKSSDAIAAAGFFLSQLQSIVSRELDPVEPVVVSVGRIDGGTAYNVIASELFMHGTVRTLNSLVREVVRGKIEDRLRGIAVAHCITYDYEYHFGCPPVVNSSEIAKLVRDTGARILGQDRSTFLESPSMVGEDFAYFLQRIPGAILLLGVGDETTCRFPLHHPRFTFNDSILMTGVRILSQLAIDYLIQSS